MNDLLTPHSYNADQAKHDPNNARKSKENPKDKAQQSIS
jgi:hypothetical protein